MNVGAYLLIFFLIPAISLGQEIGVGVVTGIESRSSAYLETADIGILARVKENSAVLLPEVTIGYQAHDMITMGLGLSYRTQTLSISAWDPTADTCRLCPLVKGGGPSASEMRLRPFAQIRVTQQERIKIFMSFGMVWAIRFGHDANLTDAPDSFKPLFGELTSALNSNPTYFFGGVGLHWKRITGEIRYEHTSSYTEQVTFGGLSYPFLLSESRLLFHLSYRFNLSRG